MHSLVQDFVETFKRFQLESVPSNPLTRVERFSNFIQMTDFTSGDAHNNNTILSPTLGNDPSKIQKIVAERVEYFKSVNKNFEWKLYDFDHTSRVEQELIQTGFWKGREDQVMFAPTNLSVKSSVHDLRVLPVKTDEDFSKIENVQNSVWNEKSKAFLERLKIEAEQSNSRLDIFMTEYQGQVISCGWVRHYGEISFFFGGSTLAEFRGLGSYAALVRERILVSRKRGSKYVVSECSPDSEKALRKLKFSFAGQGRVYNYDVKKI